MAEERNVKRRDGPDEEVLAEQHIPEAGAEIVDEIPVENWVHYPAVDWTDYLDAPDYGMVGHGKMTTTGTGPASQSATVEDAESEEGGEDDG